MIERLYNGIMLPDEWPPKYGPVTREPMPVPYLSNRPTVVPIPYLSNRPTVVPIDVGRQLFVDDFLVEETTLRRSMHQAEFHPASPVLVASKPWEEDGESTRAAPFSDGVWYDPLDGKIKMWYLAGHQRLYTCYAESQDGIHWEKPELDVEPGTNIVMSTFRDSNTIWLDDQETDPNRRFKEEPILHAFVAFLTRWDSLVRSNSPIGEGWRQDDGFLQPVSQKVGLESTGSPPAKTQLL